jgi:ADP-heptose:LPS heptosyltransferase
MLKIDTMRFLDRYVGLALCSVLDLYELVRLRFAPRRRPTEGRDPESILLIKLWGIGSVILSKPAMAALKIKFPRARLVYVTFGENKRILEALGIVDEIICIRRKGTGVFLADTVRAMRRIRKIRPAVGVDLEFLSKYSLLLMHLSGIPQRIGFYLPKMYRGKRLLTDRVFYSMYKHVAESFMELVRVLGTDENGENFIDPPGLAVKDEWMRGLDEKLERALGKRYDRLVAINPNAGELGIERRRWPAGSFVELVGDLSRRHENVGFVLTGSDDEVGYVEEIRRAVERPNVASLAGRLSIAELAALLKKSCLVVTNDSGPLHIAAAVGARTVSFFGPETPLIYSPLGEGHVVFYKGIYCSPCHNMFNAKRYHCPFNNRCLREIGVKEVFDAAEREIEQAAQVPGKRKAR